MKHICLAILICCIITYALNDENEFMFVPQIEDTEKSFLKGLEIPSEFLSKLESPDIAVLYDDLAKAEIGDIVYYRKGCENGRIIPVEDINSKDLNYIVHYLIIPVSKNNVLENKKTFYMVCGICESVNKRSTFQNAEIIANWDSDLFTYVADSFSTNIYYSALQSDKNKYYDSKSRLIKCKIDEISWQTEVGSCGIRNCNKEFFSFQIGGSGKRIQANESNEDLKIGLIISERGEY